MPTASPPPRITPGTLRSLGLVNWTLGHALSLAAGAKEAHLFSVLGQQKKLFRAWLHFSGQLMPGGLIGRHETELVILRVAHLRDCAYEIDHHVRIGRRAGIDQQLLECVFEGPSASTWSPRHRALLSAVDALVTQKNVDDAAWAELRSHYSEPQAIELCLLVGQYEMLATTIATLRIPRDF